MNKPVLQVGIYEMQVLKLWMLMQVLTLLLALGLSGCGSSSSSQTTTPVVALTITTNLPPATYTVPYTGTVTVSGGTPPYAITMSKSSAPWLTFSNGVLSGTPTLPSGDLTVAFGVIDSAVPLNTATTGPIEIPINYPTVLTVLTSSLSQGEVGVSYSQSLDGWGGVQPYTYSISAGALPPGLVLNVSPTTISGTPTTTGTYNFTFQVTDSASPPHVAKANLSITIASPLTITTTSLPNASVGTVYVQPLQITGGVPPYVFTPLNPGNSPNELSGVISFVPKATGVVGFGITVSDAALWVAGTALDVTVTAADCPNNSLFKGNYAILLNGPIGWRYGEILFFQSFVGSFVADGAGNIAQGYLDNGSDITRLGLSGSYCIGPNNIGTLSYPDPIDDYATDVYLMEVDSSGNAEIMVYQNSWLNGPPPPPFGFGTILKQDTTAFSNSNFIGDYSFGLSGAGENEEFGWVAGGLEFQAGTFSSDGAGNLNGELERNGAGNSYNAPFTASDFVVDPSGRGTATLNESGGVTAPEIFYVVNASELIALAAPASTTYIVGSVVQNLGGPYTSSSLNGVTVFGLQGTNKASGIFAQVGSITWDGGGNFTLTADQNQGGTLTSESYSGTYNVASDGRVTLTASEQSPLLVFYLSGTNRGVIIGTGFNLVNGQFFEQSSGPFGNGSFAGRYFGRMSVSLSGAIILPQSELDDFSANGAGTLTGTSYLDDQFYGPSSVAISWTYTVSSSGRGVVSESGNQTNIFYVVSPTQVLMMPSASQYPKVITLSHP